MYSKQFAGCSCQLCELGFGKGSTGTWGLSDLCTSFESATRWFTPSMNAGRCSRDSDTLVSLRLLVELSSAGPGPG